jgi:hypothetical protein
LPLRPLRNWAASESGWHGQASCPNSGWHGQASCPNSGWHGQASCPNSGWHGQASCPNSGWHGQASCQVLRSARLAVGAKRNSLVQPVLPDRSTLFARAPMVDALWPRVTDHARSFRFASSGAKARSSPPRTELTRTVNCPGHSDSIRDVRLQKKQHHHQLTSSQSRGYYSPLAEVRPGGASTGRTE